MLLVPALDFTGDGWLHSRMALVRGVESGLTVVRAAAYGRLTVTDAGGAKPKPEMPTCSSRRP